MDCNENIALLFDVKLTSLAVGNLTSNASDFERVRVGVRVRYGVGVGVRVRVGIGVEVGRVVGVF